MRTLDRLRLRLRSLFRGGRVERELRDELLFHVEELTRQKLERGMDPRAARAEALREFGGVAQLQEECRDQRRTRPASDFAADAAYALRLFARTPGFTAVALLSLALGIGANSALFTLVEALVLRDLPVRDPGALVQIVGVVPGQASTQGSFSYPTFEWLRARTPMFSHVFTFTSRRLEAGQGEAMEWVAADLVSDDYFGGLGAPAGLGRTLASEREEPAVAVLSHRWWTRRYDADPAMVGRTVRLAGIPFTVVGVLPEGFSGAAVGAEPDVFLPLSALTLVTPDAQALERRNASWLPLLARLAPGVDEARAAAGLEPLWAAMIDEAGATDGDGKVPAWFARLKSGLRPASNGISNLRQRFLQPLRILGGVVVIVWLIACLNLCNLMLARNVARQREIALRLAMGAGRGRVLRQLLAESLVLAVAGAALGMLFAAWSCRLLVAWLSSSRDVVALDVRPGAAVLLFTAATTVVTTLLFGLLPALRALRPSLQPFLKQGGHQIAGGGASATSRSLLVAQVALSLLLVAGASVFLRTFRNLLAVEMGFDASRVLVASVEPGRVGWKGEAAAAFYRDLEARLRALPGVGSVSFASATPVQGCCWWDVIEVQGDAATTAARRSTYMNSVAPGYFAAVGQRLLRGRDFDARDALGGAPVVIVNESFVRRYFGRRDPIGGVLSLPAAYKRSPMQIVGVVADARFRDPRNPVQMGAYFPVAQAPDRPASLEALVRTSGPPLALASAVRREVHAFHPAIPVRFRSLEQEVEGVLTRERLLALLSSFFGAVALALGAIGLYGVVAYSVTRRTGEIGVRVALGASRGSVLWLVLRPSVLLVGAGLGLGCVAAGWLTGFVQNLVFGVQPAGAATLLSAAAVLGATALAAAWLPARRAAALDPVRALRCE